MSLDIVRSGLLEGVPHGFFGRKGGVSAGAVASLNCGLGSGDDPNAVETESKNRRATENRTNILQNLFYGSLAVVACFSDIA